MGLHAFRHTFATLLDRVGETTTAMTGHWDGQAPPSVLEWLYIERGTLPLHMATLAKFVPPEGAPAYRKAQFRQALNDVLHLQDTQSLR